MGSHFKKEHQFSTQSVQDSSFTWRKSLGWIRSSWDDYGHLGHLLNREFSVQKEVAKSDVWTRHKEMEIILDKFSEFIITPVVDYQK